MRAGECFGGWKAWRDFGGLAEEAAEEITVLFGGSGGEAVVADSGEAFGQDVETPAADKFVGMEF